MLVDKNSGFCAAISKSAMCRGNITIVPSINNGIGLYRNARQAYIANAKYEQVFSGLTHDRRDVLVVDFDYGYSLEERNRILSICKENNIPNPSYIEVHTNKHWQIGWWLDSYFRNFQSNPIVHTEFNLLTATFTKIFKGDPHFTGGWIKNPFCNKTTVEELSFSSINSASLLYCIKDLPCIPKSFLKDTTKSDSNFSFIPTGTKETSRNCNAFKELRTYIFKERRSTGIFPSLSDCYNFALKQEQATARGQVYGTENIKNIQATVHSVYTWCIKNFKDSNSSQRSIFRKGVICEQANRAFKYFQYLELGKVSGKDTAKLLGVTPSCISKIKKCNIKDMLQYLNDFVNVPGYMYLYSDKCQKAQAYLQKYEKLLSDMSKRSYSSKV